MVQLGEDVVGWVVPVVGVVRVEGVAGIRGVQVSAEDLVGLPLAGMEQADVGVVDSSEQSRGRGVLFTSRDRGQRVLWESNYCAWGGGVSRSLALLLLDSREVSRTFVGGWESVPSERSRSSMLRLRGLAGTEDGAVLGHLLTAR